MRTKEFTLFIIIFTIVYIVFFVVLDKILDKKAIKDARKHAESMINMEQYKKFASFYGLQATASQETILSIYDSFKTGRDCIISTEAQNYNLPNLEFVVVILYLEYLGLIIKKIIALDVDSMKKTTFVEQNMFQKYNTYFQEKTAIDSIIAAMGQNAMNDLSTMDKQFLMPGVRLIDSKLYYVGDYL